MKVFEPTNDDSKKIINKQIIANADHYWQRSFHLTAELFEEVVVKLPSRD